ncbi:MAG TPA: tetratricopeptide repeat protein [Steroidobacteraceae bacterium]|nr:tetratricopeptide repeat protein [Steroidobacteraceae bacterium]
MTKVQRMVRRAAVLCGLSLVVPMVAPSQAAAPPAEVRQCLQERLHGQETMAQKCFMALTRANAPYLRAEGDWGLDRYDAANAEFRAAVAQADANALYRTRWGELLHERFNSVDAAGLFREALQRDPRDAQALLGLARVSADGFDDKAVSWAQQALAVDPKLAPAHELLAELALQDDQPEIAGKEADTALALDPEALDAMALHAVIEILADRSGDAWWARIRGINAAYGRGYAIAAEHLIFNRRYQDGVALYRKALELSPHLWSARSELGINLMRLGQDEEARQQLMQCYDNGYRNDATVNSLRLLDTLRDFATFTDSTTILKLHRKEAQLLYPYFHDVLTQAITAYQTKYHMQLDGPVQVEVYPDHEDFAVRTLGMPGLGALGVTFGQVVAMDSPSGRKPGEFHWASTLRHELSHVFILKATRHRVPRWFTEGLAVHEETAASPEWGDPITPDIIVALRDHKLLPVAELDRGFIHPQYDTQVLVSYFEAGRICDYIQSRWGAAKLLELVRQFAIPRSTPEAIRTALGMEPAAFDAQFQAWLYQDTASLVSGFDAWHKQLAALVSAMRARRYDEVLNQGESVIALYPDYVFDANAYQMLAEAALAEGRNAIAISALRRYVEHRGREPASLEELAKLQSQAGDRAAAIATLEQINFIDPVFDTQSHRQLGDLLMEAKDFAAARREFNAVLAMQPLDKAQSSYDLARACHAMGDADCAMNAVLAALEVAPDFKPAQKLLLELTGQ